MAERHYRELRRAKAQNIPATIKRIFSYCGKYTSSMLAILFCLLVSSLTNVVSSYFFKPIIDDYIIPLIGKKEYDLTGFIKMLIFIGALYLIATIFSWVWRRMVSVLSTGVLNDIRKALFAKMQDMSVSFYDEHTHGELMNFYTNDVDMIRPLISEAMPAVYSTSINIIGIIIMMFTLNLSLTLVTLASLCVMLLVTYTLGKAGRKYFIQIQKSVSDINGYVEEMFQGQKVVKVFNHEDKAIEDFKKYNEKTFNASVMSNTFSGMLMPINGNLAYITYAIVAVLGAKMCINGEMSFGTLTSFLLFARQIAGPIGNISQQFNGMMMSIAGAERVFDLLDAANEIDEGKVTLVNVKKDDDKLVETKELTGQYGWKDEQNHTLTLLKGDIRFEDVNFHYVEGKNVLNNISLFAKPGQKIALVGSTGAGKTTITSLINRFYEISQGTITYDGIDIKRIRKASLRQSLGMVLQDTNLFSGTVMDNIRYGNLLASDEQCIEAAKLANADSFIQRLPEGYQTVLTANGANLSQGQRQLLNIARAAVANPPVLILDEATSSIDTHTEKLIEHGMDKLMNGRTVFVIAHRLSTVRNSNAILVLEHGEVIERGNHEDLLQNKGRYYQLYTGKAELD